MAPASQPPSHHRTHSLLLIQRLLSPASSSASPFTLILDSLEQSGKPLIQEYIRRANASKTPVIYVAHTALNPPRGIDTLIRARRKPLPALQAEIARAAAQHGKTLLIFPNLHPLLHPSLPPLLSALLSPTTSLLALLHTDVPTPPSSSSPYNPAPLPLLRYLATTILTTHSLAHALARRAAAARSLPPPAFGLAEERAGVLVGRGANDARGTVLELEYRRRSG
ncbi:hypothetical protein MMC15_006331, partial [Xylographa vitiligo]|nr:hypothetical protein [Xylographa vitiligo]